MNILVINGSPKGNASNTMRLTNAFTDGIANVEKCSNRIPKVEVLHVRDLNIKSCMGCFACWNKTPGKCCIDDDMAKVIEKLLWADLAIWSFPLYYFSVPGKLKTLIDRQLPMNLPFMESESKSGSHPSRYDMSGKKAVIISTCGFYTAEDNYDGVFVMFDHIYGEHGYTHICCGQGELFRVKELTERTDAYLEIVHKAGEEYISGGISADTVTQLRRLLYPREVFERMADASWGVNPDSGETEDDSFIFTKQMAALYNKSAYSGSDVILDMYYTDIDKKYRIILGKDGSTVLRDFQGEYTTLIETPISVWRSIAAGEISGPAAMMQHMYRVDGDFDLMLKWDEYFTPAGGDEGSDSNIGWMPAKDLTAKDSTKEKTSMTILLIPWIVFWIAASIRPMSGSVITVLVCAAVPILFFKYRKTIYDYISSAVIVCFSTALIYGAPSAIVFPLSYLAFGMMWSGSCFTKIPLSAHYSMYSYGGGKALDNPVFMRTNRILTGMWGILYLITPIWTYFLMKTEAASYIAIINSILPWLMGIFTAWFQKWYPKKVARAR